MNSVKNEMHREYGSSTPSGEYANGTQTIGQARTQFLNGGKSFRSDNEEF